MILTDHKAHRETVEHFRDHFDVSRAPAASGCYIMKDEKDRPIYIGKARNLRARIRTYLNESDSRYSVKFLMRRVAHIDFLVTANEKEAFLLENSLIKQYTPRYNIQLKDDKTYISLRIDTRGDYPRITIVRRYRKDGARYFGPYHSASSVRQTLRQAQRLFPLRTCTDHVMENRSRPCLYYQMKQCLAPCMGLVTPEAYHDVLRQVILLLAGRSDDLEKMLIAKIAEHAEALEFEEAARLRDRLYDLRRTMEKQRIAGMDDVADRDVFGLYTSGLITEIQILFYRGGRMIGGRNFSFERREMPVDELLSSFLLQYYAAAPAIPREILLPIDLEDAETLGAILSEERGGKVRVYWPQRGEKHALTGMACRNARKSFEEKQLEEKAGRGLAEALQKALHLPAPPARIECFDISTLQGRQTVASMAVFENGHPAKKRYRQYNIRGVTGQDDFASMGEALMRRYKRAIEENDLPDLVLIDGGKGQLNVALRVFRDLGIEDLPAAGIAKSRAEKGGGASPERIFLPGRKNPVILRQSGPALQLLARIRDEAHRFAITAHRKRRGKAALSTRLTDIPGIGPRRARLLLNKAGSIARIREASPREIAELPGFSEKLARQVLEHLNRPDTD
jgi:excinuclease ABC subunit C